MRIIVIAEGHCNTSARCDLVVLRIPDRTFMEWLLGIPPAPVSAAIATGIEPLGGPRERVCSWNWDAEDSMCTMEENAAITAGYWRLTMNPLGMRGKNYPELAELAAAINAAEER